MHGGPREVRNLNLKPGENRPFRGSIQANFWVFFGSIFPLVGLPFVLLAGYFFAQERHPARAGRVGEAMLLVP